MVKAEQVPKECLVAYQQAFKAGGGPSDGIAAAINAWPGMNTGPNIYGRQNAIIHLPLPQEASDE